MQTGDIANENFLKLAALFPNAETETIDENGEVVRTIDKDIMMQEISTCVVEGQEERYQFTWSDKRYLKYNKFIIFHYRFSLSQFFSTLTKR